MNRSTTKLIVTDGLILSSALVFFLWIGLTRFIAPDEGFYLLAARLVMQGQLVYDDFFYPQMPLFPYLYGIWLALFGFTWDQARIFASLLSFLCAALVYFPLKRWTNTGLAICGLLLFVTSGLVVGWFPTAKTYNASTLLCLLSYLLLCRDLVGKHPALIFTSGVLIGLTVNCRLFYAVLVPVFILWVFLQCKEHRYRNTALFVLGGFLTLLPHLYLAIVDWASYWFNNLGYHRLRSEMAPEQVAEHRRFMIEVALGLRQEARSDGFQLPILLLGTALHFVHRLVSKRVPDMAFWIGAILFFVSLTPVPIHLQYFCVSVPFFAICTILFVYEGIFQANLGRVKSLVLKTSSFVLLIVYLSATPNAIQRHIVTGYGVHGVEEGTEETSRYHTAQLVSKEIDLLTSPGEIILSQWPGYIFESHAMPYPGTENQFWVRVGHRLNQQEREHFKIVNRPEFRSIVTDPDLRIVVIESQRQRRYFRGRILEENSFELAKEINGVYIYRRKDVNKQ